MAPVNSRVIRTLIASALAAAAGAVTALAPAAAADPLPSGLVKPLSQTVTTLASCGDPGSVGVEVAGHCYAATSQLSGGSFQILVVDRSSMSVVANDVGSGSPLSYFASYGSDRNRFWILNAPQGLQLNPEQAQLVQTNLDIPVARQGLPLSMIAIAGCSGCPKTLNAGYRLGVGGAGGPAGQIKGHFQRANTGNHLFTWPDYVPFDTQVLDGPRNAPVMRVGDNTYQAHVPRGGDGFTLLMLTADTLEPVPASQLPTSVNPGFYAVTPEDDQSDKLVDALATPNAIVLLQSVGRPQPSSLDWNLLVDKLTGLGGTRALLNSLNSPSSPGLNSPRGYAFVGLTGTKSSSEATAAPANQPIALHGLLARQRSTLFAPFLAESAGLLDRGLYEIAYQAPTPFPMAGAADAAVIRKIQELLSAQGFPLDVSLRDAYWTNIADPRWQLYKATLDALKNPDPSTYPRFDIVKAQLQREFSALLAIRSVLVDADGIRSTLDLANAVSGGTLDLIADKIVSDLKSTEAPPDEEVFAKAFSVITNVLTIAAGSLGAPKLGDAAQALSASSVVAAGLLAMGGLASEQSGGGAADATDAVRSSAAEVGQRLATQFQSAVLQLQQVAAIYVSDYGKLFAAARSFSTNPAYRFDTDTRIASVNTFAQAARQTMFEAILPASLRWGYTSGPAFGRPYPRQCFDAPRSTQAITLSYELNNGALTPVPNLRFFLYQTVGEDIDPDKLAPSASLLDALFSEPEVDVPFGGGSIQGAGFDPGTFLDRVRLPETLLPCFAATTDGPPGGALVTPMSGANQRARVGTPFPEPLTARLTNSAGMPLSGQVTFNGSAGGATFGGNISTTVPADAGGVATSPAVRAGSTPLSYSISATSSGAATVFPAVNDPALTLSRVVGDGQEAAPDTRFPLPLVAKVTDPAGHPVPGVPVTFTADNYNAWFYDTRIDGLSSTVTVVTDGTGLATSGPLHAGTILLGAFDVPATIPGQPGLSTAFHLARTQTPSKPASTTRLASLDNPAIVGDPVSLQASVEGAPGYPPTGSVTFRVDGTVRGTAPIDPYTGLAVLDPISGLSVGDHEMVAEYSGDAVYRASTDSLTQVVSKLLPKVTVASPSNGAAVGQELRFTASVSGVARSDGGPVIEPTGSVRFTVDGTPLGGDVAITSGKAVSAPISSLDPGVHEVVATYSGDGLYRSADQSYVQAVIGKWATAVAVTADPEQPVVGQPVTFTANVTANPPATGTPSGHVRFLGDFSALPGCDGLPLTNGSATCTTTYTAPTAEGDPHQVSVGYSGDSIDEVSQSPVLAVPVAKGDTHTVLHGPPDTVVGQVATYTATVEVVAPAHGSPSGTIAFLDDEQPIAGCEAVQLHGKASTYSATCTTENAHAASHVIRAVYSGDANLHKSTSKRHDHVVRRASTSTTLTAVPESSVTGQAVVLSATVTIADPGRGIPAGTVSFTANDTDIPGCTDVPISGLQDQGHADCITAFDAGAKALVATYSGTSDFEASSSRTNHQVAKAGTTTALTAQPTSTVYGNDMHLTAAVSVRAPGAGLPSGTVAFYDGSESIGTAQIGSDGTATLTATDRAAGLRHLRAEYEGSADYKASSGMIDATVAKAETAMTADQATRASGSKLFTTVVTVKAQLTRTDDGRPVAGQAVTFTKGSTALCTATTAVDGVATCSATVGSLSLLFSASYSATFAGSSNYAGSTAAARL